MDPRSPLSLLCPRVPVRVRVRVRRRDSYTERYSQPAGSSSSFNGSASFSSTQPIDSMSATQRERLKKFESTRTNTLRPIVFQPNGSFRALKENGKLAVGPEEADLYKGRIKNPLAETAYHLPYGQRQNKLRQREKGGAL